jgi:2-keto-4-pentenoate hydratase/2-oxohepta-3-ene-1,7-dioic acid hydratase in catechol pathway
MRSVTYVSPADEHELEVAAVIGRPGANIPVAAAAEHIAGYSILCDCSARDPQELELRGGLGPAKPPSNTETAR